MDQSDSKYAVLIIPKCRYHNKKPASKRKIIISKLLRYAWKARSDQLIPKTSELYPTSTQPEFEMDFSVAGVINRIEEEEEEEIEEEYVI